MVFLKRSLKIISMGLLIFIVFSMAILSNALNNGFFVHEFSKQGVMEHFNGIDMEKYNEDVINYMLGLSAQMPDEISLNDRGIAHMQDVRRLLIKWIVCTLLAAIGLILFIWIGKIDFRILLIHSSICGLVLFIIIALALVMNFRGTFSLFHSLFFAGGSWMFANEDNIINIYPIGLWRDLLWNIAISFLFMETIILFISKKLKLRF